MDVDNRQGLGQVQETQYVIQNRVGKKREIVTSTRAKWEQRGRQRHNSSDLLKKK